jgi:hypothetical protein
MIAHPARLPAAPQITYPLSYLMRTDVGKGPLELLALRGFRLPARIFAVAAPNAAAPPASIPTPIPIPTPAQGARRPSRPAADASRQSMPSGLPHGLRHLSQPITDHYVQDAA